MRLSREFKHHVSLSAGLTSLETLSLTNIQEVLSNSTLEIVLQSLKGLELHELQCAFPEVPPCLRGAFNPEWHRCYWTEYCTNSKFNIERNLVTWLECAGMKVLREFYGNESRRERLQQSRCRSPPNKLVKTEGGRPKYNKYTGINELHMHMPWLPLRYRKDAKLNL